MALCYPPHLAILSRNVPEGIDHAIKAQAVSGNLIQPAQTAGRCFYYRENNNEPVNVQ